MKELSFPRTETTIANKLLCIIQIGSRGGATQVTPSKKAASQKA